MNLNQLIYLLIIYFLHILLICVSRLTIVKQKLIKQHNPESIPHQNRQLNRLDSQIRPDIPLSPINNVPIIQRQSSPKNQIRRKTRKSTIQIIQQIKAKNVEVRNGRKLRPSKTLILENLNNLNRKQERKSTIIANPAWVQQSQTQFNENTRSTLEQIQQDKGEKQNKSILYYWLIVRGFINMANYNGLTIIQCLSKCIIQSVYCDLITANTYSIIFSLLVVNRILDRFVRKYTKNKILWHKISIIGYMLIIIGFTLIYIFLAEYNWITVMMNVIDLFAVDFILMILHKLYKASWILDSTEQQQIQ